MHRLTSTATSDEMPATKPIRNGPKSLQTRSIRLIWELRAACCRVSHEQEQGTSSSLPLAVYSVVGALTPKIVMVVTCDCDDL